MEVTAPSFSRVPLHIVRSLGFSQAVIHISAGTGTKTSSASCQLMNKSTIVIPSGMVMLSTTI